ncbi:MAG: hypothetical protein AMS25_03120 [Gemmatimonas sp. SM23_52]|nr:MAG: hypothetical protein AMS25_03120 [Gemmatimonas sp. SM23_52]
MAYYLNLFSPETFETFEKSARGISGFRIRHRNAAGRIHPGDKLVCYMTKLSRWVGVLEVASDYFIDDSPIFYEHKDPFVVRFSVRVVAWLPKERAIPIHEAHVWEMLSFTRGHDQRSRTWTGKIRTSLVRLEDQDGRFLEQIILEQAHDGTDYPVDEELWSKYVSQRVRRPGGSVVVTVPEETEDAEETDEAERPPGERDFDELVRESVRMQALLARIGETMGFRIWLPRRDRSAVFREWQPGEDVLLEQLPLNYDETTLKTIEQIDVLWLKGRSIARAFEVEHTTAVYSGILRMADLLALQPNMDIKLHIVAPVERREKVVEEIRRPVFSLLERGPLSDSCTFISYDSLQELSESRHLQHLSDAVLEEYAEEAE